MNIGNVAGALGLAYEHPKLVPPFAVHLLHRLKHAAHRDLDEHVHPPEQITIVVTDRCNLRCKMCQYAYSDVPGYHLDQVGDMPPQLFNKLLGEIPGHPVFSFTGGEPLLHPDIERFVAATRARNCLSTVTTNGWLLKKKAASLCAAGLDVLVVSVDGGQAVHDAIRGGKSFERLRGGIRAVKEQERQPVLYLNMTISDQNDDQLLAVYGLAKEWGVDGLNFNHLWMQTEAMVERQRALFPHFAVDEVAWDVDPEAVHAGRVADQLETIRRLNRSKRLLVTELPRLNRRQIEIWYQDTARFVKYGSTRCAWTRMKIWPDGQVKPCREWVVGSVAEENAMTVWLSQPYQAFRELLAQQGAIPICSRCCYMTHR